MLSVLAGAAYAAAPNIVLVSLDQLRADQLHCYGNPRATSPEIDRMAAEGTLFTRFYSAAPWTTPSYGSIMTSLYPSRHGVTLFWVFDRPALDPHTSVLAEQFQQAGYETAAFVNNSNAGAFLTRRGFDEYYEQGQFAPNITERTGSRPDSRAPATTQRVLVWLERDHAKPFFLFVLYIEPHSPYDPPPEHDLFRSGRYAGIRESGSDPVHRQLLRLANLRDRDAIERNRQLYDGKIHFIDSYFGKLLAYLRSSGLERNTIVLLTSDHGELLFSHPDDYLTTDHRSLYNAALHVPCILWGAGIPKNRRVNALASNIDIAPSLLDLAKLPAMPGAEGVSLRPALRGETAHLHDFVFSEQDVLEPLRCVQNGHYKLILHERGGAKQLFDEITDPKESKNIAAAKPEVVARLSAALENWRRQNEPSAAQRDAKWRALLDAWSSASRASRHLAPETIVNDVTIGAQFQLRGRDWNAGRGHGGYEDDYYWVDPAKNTGHIDTALWRTDMPMLGRYRISAWFSGIPGGASVPFMIHTAAGNHTSKISPSSGTAGWRTLGVFEDPISVSVTNRAAEGRVIADAVRFERLGSAAKKTQSTFERSSR